MVTRQQSKLTSDNVAIISAMQKQIIDLQVSIVV